MELALLLEIIKISLNTLIRFCDNVLGGEVSAHAVGGLFSFMGTQIAESNRT